MANHILKKETLDISDSPDAGAHVDTHRKSTAIGICQVELSVGAGSVKIQGRISPDFAWVDINDVAVTSAFSLSIWPQMRALTTITGDGLVVNVGLMDH